MSVPMAEHLPRTVDFFRVLARARCLLPDARAILDPRALVNPDTMAEALRMCGATPAWATFDSGDASHLERLIEALGGDVHLVGHSSYPARLRVIRVRHDEPGRMELDVDLGFDVTLIGVTARAIGLIHHEGLCAVVTGLPAHGSPEDARELERHWMEQAERRRNEALSCVPPAVREGMLEMLEEKRHVAAIKYLRERLGCSLSTAKGIVDAVQPWWP